MATNKLTEVAGLVAQAVMGAKVKDKDGNDKTVKPTGDDNLLDLRDIVAGGSSSGGGDNPDNPNNPSAGADYYAGSLADGEITERNLEWSGTDDPTKDLTVTFKDDPGSNPFGQYSGLTILGHIQKTVMTSGTKGAVSNLELNYDPSNATKDGYFTTTSPYPIYISQSDIASGQELDVPINGIGEGLEGDNTKPAMIHLKYNSDKTMTISHEDGYVNDGSSAGATGANYSFVVEIIATFSTQKAVAQLPASVNLFSGNADGQIALSGSTDFFENVMDGIQIKLNDYVPFGYDARLKTNDILSKTTIKIEKDKLINGMTLTFKLSPKVKHNDLLNYEKLSYGKWSLYTKATKSFSSVGDAKIQIGQGTVTFEANVNLMPYPGGDYQSYPFKVGQINSVKD